MRYKHNILLQARDRQPTIIRPVRQCSDDFGQKINLLLPKSLQGGRNNIIKWYILYTACVRNWSLARQSTEVSYSSLCVRVCRLSFSDAITTVDGYGYIFLCENIALNGEQEEGDLEK